MILCRSVGWTVNWANYALISSTTTVILACLKFVCTCSSLVINADEYTVFYLGHL